MNTFFDFSERHKTALINFLQDALAKNNEFEIRFGKFYHDRQKKQSTFDSNFDIESFYNLKKMLKNIPNKEIITKEFVYKNPSGHGNIKKIINTESNTETILLKNTLKKYDIYDYDLRLSTSYEKTKGITLDTNLEYDLIRNKKRTSYIFDYGHLDLTIVSQTYKGHEDTNDSQQKYEVELEITKNDIQSILSLIGVILQTRQDNFYIISEFEKRNIIDEYKKLVNAPYFIGAQPETLHKDKITTLYKQNYSVTDKADGDRAFMYIDNSGKIYFIDNNLNRVYKTDLSSSKRKANYYSSIIDGEIVKHENKIHFLAFDVMFYNGEDLRGKDDYKLKTRLNRLNDIIRTIDNSNYYNVEMKKFYYTNVFMGSKIIMDTINDNFYKNDGLIFTPVNEPYPIKKKWPQLLKWKPSELNSIDFYSVKISSENGIGKWQLYVQGESKKDDKSVHLVGKVPHQKTEKVLFDIEKLCGETKTQIITYETTFPDNTIDPSTDEFYQTNTVIEYRYEHDKFVPMRTRWDKTVNPRKHGNFSQVACDIWNNIHNPIEKELLFQFTVNSNKDFFFERMRKFHNKVKEYLYNKYCKDIDNLLELCSGKGGDLHKWLYNNVKNVCGYDISEKNILECQRRINSLKDNNINTSFYKLDLTKKNSDQIIYNNNPEGFNVVSCQFGIHYFFQSKSNVDNLINILNKSLLDNGYFIITFLDNTKLDNLFGNKNLSFYEKDGEIMYLIERQTSESVEVYGNKLQITLNGNNILGEGSNEWIINFENFKNLLQSNGYQCIESELFENIYDNTLQLDGKSTIEFDTKDISLTNCEKNISFLNRYCVFKKSNTLPTNVENSRGTLPTNVENSRGTLPTTLPTNIEDNTYKMIIDKIPLPVQNVNMLTDVKTEYNFETIDLQQKNISVYKIVNLYDIVDLINCIEYKYYKNKVENLVLDENVINNINGLFKNLNIEYTPHFINDPLNFEEYKSGKTNIYFTHYKHTIEKNNNLIDSEDSMLVEYNNWYIIMYHNQILFDKPNTLQLDGTCTLNKKDINIDEDVINKNEESLVDKSNKNVENNIINNKDGILSIKFNYENLKKNGEKITIKILKELLTTLNLKTSGKKEELQNRLENAIKTN